MGKSCSVLIILLCVVIALSLLALGRSSRAEYPWVHYFERPDFPEIHCAFADADGSVIVSTGDWNDSWYDELNGDIVYTYWSKGMFRIREGDAEAVQCPARTYVLDCATDSAGITWILFTEGLDYRTHVDVPAWQSQRTELDSVSRSRDTGDYRLARVEGGSIVVDDELTASIPLNPVAMISDTRGRVFVTSYQEVDSGSARHFISWWSAWEPGSLHIQEVPDAFDWLILSSAPSFGPDGFVYFLASNTREGYYAHPPSGVMALDPEAAEWDVYYGGNAAIYCLYVDQFNVKWFGTEDGLVRFDGENWTRFTPESSNLAFNVIRNIGFDSADRIYYVVSQGRVDGEYPTAISYLGLDGQFRVHSDYFDALSFLPVTPPRLMVDAGNVWWFKPYVGYSVFSYDHERVVEWDIRDWLDAPSGSVGYIGSTGTGRHFCATYYAVMIW